MEHQHKRWKLSHLANHPKCQQKHKHILIDKFRASSYINKQNNSELFKTSSQRALPTVKEFVEKVRESDGIRKRDIEESYQLSSLLGVREVLSLKIQLENLSKKVTQSEKKVIQSARSIANKYQEKEQKTTQIFRFPSPSIKSIIERKEDHIKQDQSLLSVPSSSKQYPNPSKRSLASSKTVSSLTSTQPNLHTPRKSGTNTTDYQLI